MGEISRRSVLARAGVVTAGAFLSAGAPHVAVAEVVGARVAAGREFGRGAYRVVSAYARMGEFPDLPWQKTGWENISFAPGDGDGSLPSTVTSRAGVGCWATSTAPARNDFLYGTVAGDYKPASPGGSALVEVVYFDDGPGHFCLHYGSVDDAYASTEVVRLVGGDAWRVHVFALSDVSFANGQTGGADFRISSWDPELGRSPTDVAVSDVALSFAHFYPRYHVTVVSPAVGATVHGTTTIDFYAPGMKNVQARAQHAPDDTHPEPYDDWFQNVTPDPRTGRGRISFPARRYPRGPLTVTLDAWDSPAGDPGFTHTDAFYLQLVNRAGDSYATGIPARVPPQAAGMRVVFEDDFRGPLSISATGAGTTYAALKPDPSAPTGGAEFGDGIFADPDGPHNPFAIVDKDYLRIRSTRVPVGYVDPQPWDRRHFGGLLSSLRLDGTGVAVQDGYFEARMLAPGGKGTWPAFWLLPQQPVAADDPAAPAVEVDITELYGDQETRTYATYHLWNATPGVHDGTNSTFPAGNPFFTGWHVYGAKLTATDTIYYVDDVEVYRHATVEQGRTPMFFMINLSLGSGWPVNLTTKYDDQADLYVDYVRVFGPAD